MLQFVVKTTYTKELVKKGLEVYVFHQKNSKRILMVESALLIVAGLVLIAIAGFRLQFILVTLLGVGGLLLARFSSSLLPPIRDERAEHTYTFSEQCVTVEDARGKKNYAYSKFNRLYETDDAVFLFAGSSTFFPLWKSDLEEVEWESLKNFLEQKTKRTFRKATV